MKSKFRRLPKKRMLNLTLKQLIAPLCWLIYLIGICIALPLLIIERNRNESSRIDAWFIGGMFVLATLPLSISGIISHALNYQKPYLQKYIIRILFLVPIFALNSWFVLRFPKSAIYLDTFRECYEAFVIYNFMIYLCNYLNYEISEFSEILESKENISLIFPFCFLPSCSNGVSLLRRCKFGVLQYTLVRVLTTCVAFICELCGVYKEGDINFKYAWPYLIIVNNFSQMIAMYCLILFYTLTRNELKPLNPILQFLCIKFVVFATFWQGVLIAILVKAGIISTDRWPYYPTIVETANGLQDFIICIEMLPAAIAHLLAFRVTPYRIDTTQNWWRSILNAADVSDVHSDVMEHYKRFSSRVKVFSTSTSSIIADTIGSSKCDHLQDINEATRLIDNESFNSYSYASTIKSTNPDTASNFSNTAMNIRILQVATDQASLINLYPSGSLITNQLIDNIETQKAIDVNNIEAIEKYDGKSTIA